MKINKLISFAFAGIILMTACTKKTDTSTSTSFSTTPAMSATISGTAWTSTYNSATTHSAGTTNQMGISGWLSSGSSISMVVPANVTPGTYKVDEVTFVLNYNKDANNFYKATSGTITITNYENGYVNGNFQGTLAKFNNPGDVVTISDGSFTDAVQ